MRFTRSATRAEEAVHVDAEVISDAQESAIVGNKKSNRSPLSEVSGNALENPSFDVAMPDFKKGKAKGKKAGKKDKKDTKGILILEDDTQTQVGTEEVVLEDERLAAASPASEAAVEELLQNDANVTTELKVLEDRPVTPRSRAVRTTRRLLRNQEQAQAKTHNEPAVNVTAQLAEDAHIGGLADSGDSDVLREQKSLAIEKSNASPSKAREPTSPAVLTAASIEAIDALEEAVEEVAMSIPNLSLSPEKMCRAKGSPNPAQGDGSSSEESDRPIAPALKKSSAPKAPKSAKEAKKPVATAKRVTAPATRPALSRSASVRTASWKGGTAQGKSNVESTDYLATKRRPISMSFPAPPAPAKSANAPTKPTFQLPGEAVAARLKAQREERLKKEEEEAQKKREFKARPVPRTSIAPVTVKQTAASRARQSLIFNGSEMQGLSISENAQPLRRASSINAGSVANATAKRQSSITSKRSSVIMPPPAVAKPSANTSRPRVSASASSLSASSLSAAAPAATKSAVTAAEVAVQRVKAREIFNRDRVEKERRERERREKEEAAKRARAQAAERGRLASREWAEKQKARKVAVVPLVGGAGARAGAAGAAAAEVEAAPSAA